MPDFDTEPVSRVTDAMRATKSTNGEFRLRLVWCQGQGKHANVKLMKPRLAFIATSAAAMEQVICYAMMVGNPIWLKISRQVSLVSKIGQKSFQLPPYFDSLYLTTKYCISENFCDSESHSEITRHVFINIP